MKMPKIWEILKRFKNVCSFHGWRTSESEDWIKIGDEYHTFLWARDIHPSSFKRIVSNRKCVVREGLSYQVVDASYTAWLFSEPLSETFVKTVIENQDFFERVALYDLSPLLKGKNMCLKFNNTRSPVFEEFEHFLADELKVKLKQFSPFSGESTKKNDYTIEEVA